MKNRVSAFDFTPYVALAVSKGLSSVEAVTGLVDLQIILNGPVDQELAMTMAADAILHEILEDAEAARQIGEMAFGSGRALKHDGTCFGNARFDAAWNNTRAVMSAHGVDLPENYKLSPTDSARSAAACFVAAAA